MPPREEGDPARVLDDKGETIKKNWPKNVNFGNFGHLGVTIVVRGATEEEGAWSSRDGACKQKVENITDMDAS